MKFLFAVVVVFLAFCGCVLSNVGPECRWACDDPACNSTCEARCAPLNCTTVCSEVVPLICLSAAAVMCEIQCPPDQTTSESCPTCETVCVVNPACMSQCNTTCDPVNCSWECTAPRDCPEPACELLCIAPACEFVESSAGVLKISHSLLWCAVLLMVANIVL
jgi:hypothetical protein